jgi:hypothetical protein
MKFSPEHFFIARSVARSISKVRKMFAAAQTWRLNAVTVADEKMDTMYNYLGKNKAWLIAGIGVVVWIGLMAWFVFDMLRGSVQGNTSQVAVGGAIGAALVGGIVAPLVALAVVVLLFLLNRLVTVLVPIILFVPLTLWLPLYAGWQSTLVILQLLLLIPLVAMVAATRVVQLWRGIFYTCPSRDCSYRGLPAFVCDKCGEPNRKLWPNLMGVLHHPCVACGSPLPTLDVCGRKRLQQLCGGADATPLSGRHAGKARERLIAIVGPPASGKTNYLTMVVEALTTASQNSAIRAEIDDPSQEETFRSQRDLLARGAALAKTSVVTHAFLLYAHTPIGKCQLFLYDAPGEEFWSMGTTVSRQYLPLLEGVIVLVDPDSLANGAAADLDRVIASMVVGVNTNSQKQTEKLPQRVAVVISKADLPMVKDALGDPGIGAISGLACRDWLLKSGAGNAVRTIESYFENVAYFACSPLGRAIDQRNPRPFKAAGVVEPLVWIVAPNQMAKSAAAAV